MTFLSAEQVISSKNTTALNCSPYFCTSKLFVVPRTNTSAENLLTIFRQRDAHDPDLWLIEVTEGKEQVQNEVKLTPKEKHSGASSCNKNAIRLG